MAQNEKTFFYFSHAIPFSLSSRQTRDPFFSFFATAAFARASSRFPLDQHARSGGDHQHHHLRKRMATLLRLALAESARHRAALKPSLSAASTFSSSTSSSASSSSPPVGLFGLPGLRSPADWARGGGRLLLSPAPRVEVAPGRSSRALLGRRNASPAAAAAQSIAGTNRKRERSELAERKKGRKIHRGFELLSCSQLLSLQPSIISFVALTGESFVRASLLVI